MTVTNPNPFAQLDLERATTRPAFQATARPARTREQVRQIVATAAARIGATVRESDLGFAIVLGNSRVDVTSQGAVLAPCYVLDSRETLAALESARDEIRAGRAPAAESLRAVPNESAIAQAPAPLEVRHSGPDHRIVGDRADLITAAIASTSPAVRSWRVAWTKTSYLYHELARVSCDGLSGGVRVDFRDGSVVADGNASAQVLAVAEALRAVMPRQEAA